MTETNESEALRILVVKAHPHDFTHSAGTCAIHNARGDSVTVVSVTGGAKTHNEQLYDELIKPESEQDRSIVDQPIEEYGSTKVHELKKVCALFGVTDVRVLNFGQPFRVDQAPEAVEQLREIFYEVRPHVLITQSPYLRGPHGLSSGVRDDHTETAAAVMEAKLLASIPDPETKRTPHTVAATYYPGVYFMRNEIDFFVDITDWKDQRVQAEVLFASQGHTEAMARKRIEIGTGAAGWAAGTESAEGFVRAAPETLPHIIVPGLSLQRAAEPRANNLKRITGQQLPSK